MAGSSSRCCSCGALPSRANPAASFIHRGSNKRFELPREARVDGNVCWIAVGRPPLTNYPPGIGTWMRFKIPSHRQYSRLQLHTSCKGLGREADTVNPERKQKVDPETNKRKTGPTGVELPKKGQEIQSPVNLDIDCFGTGTDVECVIQDTDTEFRFGGTVPTRAVNSGKRLSLDMDSESTKLLNAEAEENDFNLLESTLETLLLISPFFFWGTAMVAMKGVLPKAGSFFVASTRLIPAGLLLLGFASLRGRKQPSGLYAWLSICVFGLVDASCFQGFLAEGLGKTSAGLGSVIIDSQPLTVAVLASILFSESIGPLGVAGLVLGVAGLLLLEVPADSLAALFTSEGFTGLVQSFNSSNGNNWTVWDSGEWYMLLAAQSMAIGTLLVRWVCKYSDPIMATGWHMVIGGVPLLALSAVHGEPAVSGHLQDLQVNDWASLAYTSVFGSAISYGVFFYNATKGSLTKLSSLTFLTPMFAAFFGYLILDESLTNVQILGATITLGAIYLVNTSSGESK